MPHLFFEINAAKLCKKLNMNSLLKYFLFLLIASTVLSCQRKTHSMSDIYVDRLVYSSTDSSLFTGTIDWNGFSTYSSISFVNGMPCGEFFESEYNGSDVTRGIFAELFIPKSTVLDSVLKGDTAYIEYWREGGTSSKYTLTLHILKDELFFQSNKQKYNNYFDVIAKTLFHNTRVLKYAWIELFFENSVLDPTKYYYVDYKIVDCKLIKEKSGSRGCTPVPNS